MVIKSAFRTIIAYECNFFYLYAELVVIRLDVIELLLVCNLLGVRINLYYMLLSEMS